MQGSYKVIIVTRVLLFTGTTSVTKHTANSFPLNTCNTCFSCKQRVLITPKSAQTRDALPPTLIFVALFFLTHKCIHKFQTCSGIETPSHCAMYVLPCVTVTCTLRCRQLFSALLFFITKTTLPIYISP